MFDAVVTPGGARIRWVEIPTTRTVASGPDRVFLHGLGAASGPYFTRSAVHPLLAAAGGRSLLLDLLGFGLSDRPTDIAYRMEDHADTVATALRAAGVRGADVVGHSMGGTVAVVLVQRHPDLVSRLLLVDPNLDPVRPDPSVPGSAAITGYSEGEFVEGGGHAELEESVGPHWWATMRLAGPEALHRSARHLARSAVREVLTGLSLPRTLMRPAADGPSRDEAALTAAGVRVVHVPACGHNIMLDNPEAFAREAALALA